MRPDLSGEEFIKGVMDLIHSAVATQGFTSDREKLDKKNKITKGMLEKAKLAAGFPATLDQVQQTSHEESADLKRLDDSIEKHNVHSGQLKASLASKFGSAFSHKAEAMKDDERFERQMAKLRQDSEDGIARLRHEFEQKLASAESTRIAKLESELASAKAASADAQRNSAHTEALVTELQNQCTSLMKSLDSTTTPKQLTENERKHIDSAVADAVRAKADVLAAIPPALPKGEATLPVNKTEAVSKGLESRLAILEETLRKYPEPDIVSGLPDQLKGIQEVKEMGDNFTWDEIEKLKAQSAKTTDEFNALKNDHARLRPNDAAPSATTENTPGQSGSHQDLQHELETVKTGLHSLETRYNSLTTEPIVKSMVSALQEMYPTASQLTEQGNRLRVQAENQHGHIQMLSRSLDELRNKVKNDMANYNDRTYNCVKDIHSLHNSGKATWDTLSLQLQPQVHRLDAAVDDLGKKLNMHVSGSNQRMSSKETADAAAARTVQEELVRLKDEIQEWKKQNADSQEAANADAAQKSGQEISRLNSEIEKLVQKSDDHRQEIAKQLEELDSIKNSISKLEESSGTSVDQEEVAALKDQMASVQESIEKIESETTKLEPLQDRVFKWESSTTRDYEEVLAEVQNTQRRLSNYINSAQTSPKLPMQTDGANSPIGQVTPNLLHMAEDNPAQALREKKKKKKRLRENSEERNPIPDLISARVSTSISGSSPLDPVRRHKKKKRKEKYSGETFNQD